MAKVPSQRNTGKHNAPVHSKQPSAGESDDCQNREGTNKSTDVVAFSKDDTNNDSGSRGELDSAIAEYLNLCERGKAPAPEAFAARYPKLSAELLQFFDNQDEFAKIAAPIRELQTSLGALSEKRPGTNFGEYQIMEEIGRGGMGVIFRAKQKSLQRTVALKMIHENRLTSSNDVERFRLEAEAAASLEHPNIVPIYEVGQHDDYHFFTMKLAAGGNLQQLVQAGLAIRSTLLALSQVAQAIHYAHCKGILHRDLKPSNILLDTANEYSTHANDSTIDTEIPNEPRTTPSLKALVSDFGLAKHQRLDGDLTATGAILGSPHYMSPEQASGDSANVSPLTDIHGLGATLYFALTGVPPFRDEELADVIHQVKFIDPVEPRKLNPAIDRDIETICLKCLDKNPQRRYSSALEVAEDIDRYLEGHPIRARPVGRIEKALKWVRREPRSASLIAVSTMCVAAIMAALIAISVLTSVEQSKTQDALKQLSDEQQATQRALWQSYVSEARAQRWSQRPGYRWRAIESIDNALQLADKIELAESQTQELRNELIDSLSILVDVRETKQRKINLASVYDFAVDFSTDFKRVAVGDGRGVVSLFDLDSDSPQSASPSFQSRVNSVQFSPDGKWLGVCLHNNELLVVRTDELKKGKPVIRSKCNLNGFDFHPRLARVAVSVPGQSIVEFDLNSGNELKDLGPSSDDHWLRYDSQGKLLAISGTPSVRIVDTETSQVIWREQNPRGFSGVSFDEKSERLVVATNTGMVQIYDLVNNSLKTIGGTLGVLSDVSFIPDSQYLLCRNWAGQTNIVNEKNNKIEMTLAGAFCRFSAQQSRIGYSTKTGVGVWELKMSKTHFRPNVQSPCEAIAFSPLHPICAIATSRGVRLRPTTSFTGGIDIPTEDGTCIAFHPTSGELITCSKKSGLRCWPIKHEGTQLTIGPPKLLPPTSRTDIAHIAFNADGSTMACSSYSRQVSLFDYGKSKLLQSFDAKTQISSISINPSGSYIAVGSTQHEATVWDSKQGIVIKRIEGEGPAFVAFASEQTLLITRPGFEVRSISINENNQAAPHDIDNWNEVTVAPSSQLIFSARTDGGYELRSGDLNRQLALLNIDALAIARQKLCVSRDGKWLAAATRMNQPLIWNLERIHQELKQRGLVWPDGKEIDDSFLNGKIEPERITNFVLIDPTRVNHD